MKTKKIILTALALALLSGAPALAATDYSAMSNEELAARRGAMQGATVEERNAFQREWQNRLQQMSPEEHQKYMRGQGPGENQGLGPGSGPMSEEKRQQMQERMQQRQEQGGMPGGPGGGQGRGGMGGGRGGGR